MSISKPKLVDLDTMEEVIIPKSAKKVMYVDNDKLSEEMIKWREALDIAKANGLPRTAAPMPDYVGAAIMLIADGLASKPCYRDYSWLPEMISDGIEACCMYLHNFNPHAITRKGKPNAFGYISRTIEREFFHRIETEKRQDYYKGKSLEMQGGVDAFAREVGEDGGPSTAQVVEDIIGRVYDYEKKQAQRALAEKDRAEKKIKPPSTTSSLLSFLGVEE